MFVVHADQGIGQTRLNLSRSIRPGIQLLQTTLRFSPSSESGDFTGNQKYHVMGIVNWGPRQEVLLLFQSASVTFGEKMSAHERNCFPDMISVVEYILDK